MKKTLMFSLIPTICAAFIVAAQDANKPQPDGNEHHVINPADLKWSDGPAGLPAGAKMAVLDGDPGQPGSFTVRLKAPAGYKVMPHTHPTAEKVTLISGKIRIGMGDKFDKGALQEVSPGGYVVMPAGMAHFVKMGAESVVQIDSEGPFQINYINPSDDPRNAKK